jgi:hypothetical protein
MQSVKSGMFSRRKTQFLPSARECSSSTIKHSTYATMLGEWMLLLPHFALSGHGDMYRSGEVVCDEEAKAGGRASYSHFFFGVDDTTNTRRVSIMISSLTRSGARAGCCIAVA